MCDDDLETALLTAIRIAPDGDDAPLRVYMDWLLERDDPRGKFMLLTLAGANSLRHSRLRSVRIAE